MPPSPHNFTYASPHDKPFKRLLIHGIEQLTGKRLLQQHYDALYAEGHPSWEVWGQALEKLGIGVDYDADQLAKFPRQGPVIFLANHPFGVVDGVILCHLVTRVRRDFFLLVNEVLAHEPIVRDHLLPIDFREGREAIRTNLSTKSETILRLQQGQALAIFPSGAVATASRIWGPAEELPWGKFICPAIHQSQCTVVPLFFHGQNSRLFQLVSKINVNLRLGLLLHEVMNKRGRTIRVEIGDPIPYSEMATFTKRQDLIDFLRDRTMVLGEY